MKYYIYKVKENGSTARYWNRKKQNWSKWFDNDCLYPTERGVDRVYNGLTKYQKFGEVIGWERLDHVRN